MATGTVKWFNEQKGFGFAQPTQTCSLSAVEGQVLTPLSLHLLLLWTAFVANTF